MKDFTLSDEKYLRKMNSAFESGVPTSDYSDAIGRLERAGYAIVKLTRERDRARRFGWCGVCVAGFWFAVAIVGWVR